jgi:hypothetical protein
MRCPEWAIVMVARTATAAKTEARRCILDEDLYELVVLGTKEGWVYNTVVVLLGSYDLLASCCRGKSRRCYTFMYFSFPLVIGGSFFTETLSYCGGVKEKKMIEESRRSCIKWSQRRFPVR